MPNLLIHEKSPYLLQHAHNPVEWLPWGEQAFQKAKAEDKPIFLSVGYSTCHWCHVMEHESFEDEAIAAILNREFVPVKVDREERPDVDRIYMSYVQAATGSGGWPMSVWLTPDLHPFVGGTYFPPDDRYGRPGFASVCTRIAQAWRNERERIGESSTKVLDQLRSFGNAAAQPGEPEPQALRRTFDYFRRTYDSIYGGFGSAPKFPRPAIFQFLLRYWAETKEQDALDMVTSTLRAMGNGGMNDQLGGGFHRYSVDAEWFVPHFEKMLYDQAQLAVAYLEAYQITGEPLFREELRRILDYVMRDLTSPEGGFYCAEDADSAPDASNPKHKSEGAFYIWTDGEIADRLFSHRYGAEPRGNVENDPHGEFTGRNILFRAHTAAETAHHFDVTEEEVTRSVEGTATHLLTARESRPRPHLDDKILTGWNGMMIGAFARAGAVLDEPRYLDAAKQAAAFIESKLIVDGRLMRRYRDGDAGVPAFLDDFANFVQGLLELYQCALDPAYLNLAIRLTEQQRETFEDADGGFYSTARGASDLVLRLKDDYDGAEPGANSVAAFNLLLLTRFTEDQSYAQLAQGIFRAFASQINQSGPSVPLLVAAYQTSLLPPTEVKLSGDRDSTEVQPFLRAYWDKFRPFATIVPAHDVSVVAATVCQNFVCQLPTRDPAEFAQLLQLR